MRAILLVAFVGTSLITTSLIAQQADIDQLIKDTTARDRSVVIKAINELGKLGPDAASAVDALARAVGSDDFEIRWQAARALGSIGPAAKRAAVVLHDALTDEAPSVRAYAAFALGRLGKTAEPSVDQLIKNVFDKEMIVRRASIRALRSIDPPIQKTMPLVLKILDQGDMSSIMPALHTLANEGKAAVPRLRAAMQSAKAAPWAAIVLAEIGPEAADAVPELTRMLGHVDPDARMHYSRWEKLALPQKVLSRQLPNNWRRANSRRSRLLLPTRWERSRPKAARPTLHCARRRSPMTVCCN